MFGFASHRIVRSASVFRVGTAGLGVLTAALVLLLSPVAFALDWEIETVDDAFNWIGSSIGIAVDDCGVPHIANGASHSEIMRYAVKEGDEWLVEQVDSYASGVCASITVDPAGVPCLAYHASGDLLVFARRVDGTWQHETVGTMHFDHASAVCVSADGTPHIAYCKLGDPWNLRHAWKSGSVWMIETADPTNAAGNDIAMVLDDAGNPHISHWAAPTGYEGPHHAKYTWWDGSAWQSDIVDDTVENYNVIHSGIALDADGGKHIVYMSHHAYGTSEVRYAVNNHGHWQTTTIDTVDRSAACSLVLDRNDSPHVVYGTRFLSSGGDSELRYARPREHGPQWDVEVIDADGDAGEYNSLAIDPQGYLHIAYFRGSGSGQAGEIRYARSTTPVALCIGDLDGDGDVDLADLATLLAHYGMTGGVSYEDGDIDGDGDVDLADLAALLANYGMGT